MSIYSDGVVDEKASWNPRLKKKKQRVFSEKILKEETKSRCKISSLINQPL
jgi:hypothetical protein